MPHTQNINIQEESDFRRIISLISRNYLLFIGCTIIAICIAFLVNRYSIPSYKVSSSILIKAGNKQPGVGGGENDFLYGNIFGGNQNFQNELWILKSYPVVERTVKNLDLTVTYYRKGKFNYYEAYKEVPFVVSYLPNHPQPVELKLILSFQDQDHFILKGQAKNATFRNFETNVNTHDKKKWNFIQNGKFGELIETQDLAFVVEKKDTTKTLNLNNQYGFKFSSLNSLSSEVGGKLEFLTVDRQATVIKITAETESPAKGLDILNELMNVYQDQNLERKNHLATITIDYIEKQLSEISDSLNIAENNLQQFRSSRQLLDISTQTNGISAQYLDLQRQMAELVSRKRYFDYVTDLLQKENFSNMMLPASIGISDPLLNNLMNEFIVAQTQRSNLIANKQERNPMVQSLGIKIENLKKTISENITAFNKSTSISIDELSKRISKIEAEINRLPATQRQLGSFERKYRLSDAIYNYLMEKHAEAKITKASNLPDDIIIEPAKVKGMIYPNKKMNYLIALFLGLGLPFGIVWIKSALNIRIESQDDVERLTDSPVLGKILHNNYRTDNVMLDYPQSNIAESIRALRTNLDFYVRGGQKKVILITSCFENEGKSFVARNLAMSYAQLGRKTILLDFDLRKPKMYFNEKDRSREGLSSFMIDKANLEDIIIKSPHEKLDYITCGILPPNPIELIALEKNEKLISGLKKNYDIIILDTTPLAQVADAYLLIEYAEIKVLITRYGQTVKNVLSLVMKDLNQKNVTNICIVLNDNREFRDQYGYGYGYYNNKGFFQRKFKKRTHLVNKV